MVTSSNGSPTWRWRADERRARNPPSRRAQATVAVLALVSAASGCDALFPASTPTTTNGPTYVQHKVQLNSVGFFPDRVKLATVVAPGGTTFNVLRASDKSV